MDMTAQGAFCHSCQTEVIDFSAMTDREVIEYLAKHLTGCGRFRNDQLDTKLSIPQIDNGIFKWKALFLGILPFIPFKTFSLPDQNRIPKIEKQDTATKHLSDIAQKDTLQRSIADTTVVLQDIIITECKNPREDHIMMGAMIKIETVMIETPQEKRTRYLNIEHPSRRQERKAWFRRFLHLD
jgi:hypothetical protein